MHRITKFNPGIATLLALAAAGVQLYRAVLELRATRAEAEKKQEDPDEAEFSRASGASWRLRVFLQGNDAVFATLPGPHLVELQRLRAVYRAGAWALTGLDRQAWAAAGVEDAAVAARLAGLGVRPHVSLAAPLTEDEAALVTAAYGRPVSASTPTELLDEDDLDGAQAFALVATRRSRRSGPATATER